LIEATVMTVSCGNFTGEANFVEGTKPKNSEDIIELAQEIQKVRCMLGSVFCLIWY